MRWEHTMVGQVEALVRTADEGLLRCRLEQAHACLMQARKIMDSIKENYHEG